MFFLWNHFCLCIFTNAACISLHSFFCTGSLFCNFSIVPLMFCLRNGFCFCFSTVLAGVGFCSFFLTSRSFGYFSTIPRMSSGFHYCSFTDQLTTILAISVTCVTIFFTSYFFFITDFCMLMPSGRNRFYICFITVCIRTMIRFLSVFCTSSFLCDRSLIQMVGCNWNLFCLCFATCLTGVCLNTFLGSCCFFCNHSVIPCMTEFIDHCSRFQFCITVCTVGISGVTIFGTGSFLCVSYFFVLMSGSRNDFCLCRIADSTGISLFSIFRTGSFFCYFSVIPGMLS